MAAYGCSGELYARPEHQVRARVYDLPICVAPMSQQTATVRQKSIVDLL